jgi:hypothetical protein
MSHLSPFGRARSLSLPLALFLLFCAGAAQAAPQTFVSAKGDDANPCEQDKPCRTFAGALLKTDVGGEVAVLDAGEYGPFKVTHSVEVGFVATGPGVHVQLQDCVATHQGHGITAAASGRATVEGCLVANHKVGIWVINGDKVFLSGTAVSDNEVGLDNFQPNPGSVYTFSNNRLFNNGVNAQGKPSFIAQQF